MISSIESIYSRIDNSKLLHQYIALSKPGDDSVFRRQNVSSESESLQLALIEMPEGHTFKAHKHIVFDRNMPRPQESWVVIRGSVCVYYYDIDDTLIKTVHLSPGDSTITYEGGHNYKALCNNTIVYEFKTGPYMGQAKDKEFLSPD